MSEDVVLLIVIAVGYVVYKVVWFCVQIKRSCEAEDWCKKYAAENGLIFKGHGSTANHELWREDLVERNMNVTQLEENRKRNRYAFIPKEWEGKSREEQSRLFYEQKEKDRKRREEEQKKKEEETRKILEIKRPQVEEIIRQSEKAEAANAEAEVEQLKKLEEPAPVEESAEEPEVAGDTEDTIIESVKRTVVYSAAQQRSDLDEQINDLKKLCQEKGWAATIIGDSGSSTKGILELVRLIEADEVERLVIAERKKLKGRGINIVLEICNHHNVEIVETSNS